MAAAVATSNVPPSQSLYIQNLPEKIQKEDLRRELYMLFSTYGPVLDVVARKTPKMRGQAHVLMRDVQTATLVMKACQGFELCGKHMKISYSKNRSHTLAKLTGTFNPTAPADGTTQASAGAASSTFAAIPGLPTNTRATQPQLSKAPVTEPVVAEKVAIVTRPSNTVSNGVAQKEQPDATAEAKAGTKRRREEEQDEEQDEKQDEDDEDEEQAMEIEDDEEAMEMSDDDD